MKFECFPKRPYLIAGPCVAEDPEMLKRVASPLQELAAKLGWEFVFKASFDKANRTSIGSYRGPGLEDGLAWMAALKDELGCEITSDVHESTQVAALAEVVDLIQIPAFLCRQTDLIVEAVRSGRAVSVKKGQFLDPANTKHIVDKARDAAGGSGLNLALMERGASFGYGNLVVDMRGLKTMAENDVPVIFDVTHSTQQPSAAATTAGLRHCAPLLARAGCASGYLSGLFVEVHPDPSRAKSDSSTQLSIEQATALITQANEVMKLAADMRGIDAGFHS